MDFYSTPSIKLLFSTEYCISDRFYVNNETFYSVLVIIINRKSRIVEHDQVTLANFYKDSSSPIALAQVSLDSWKTSLNFMTYVELIISIVTLLIRIVCVFEL